MTELVNHPPHYYPGKFEAIKCIEAWGLCFHVGSAAKYAIRAGSKDPRTVILIQDLEKAQWYLKRKIKFIKSGSFQCSIASIISQ